LPEADFLRSWESLTPPPPITLLLSGGGDSVALFHLLRRAGITFSALHFVHDGDPEFAAQGSEFCRRLCEKWEVSLDVQPVAGKQHVTEGGLSWEAACRHLRYKYLRGLSGSFLTAHTLDDQAETVLLRLLQGSGLAGLSGVRAIRGDGVYRPLLTLKRERLRDYLRELDETWLDDPSNQGGNERAQVRARILPLLEEYQPAFKEIVGRTASYLWEDERCLSGLLERWLEKETSAEGDWWWLDSVQRLDRALQWRFLKAAWARFDRGRFRPRGSLFEECLKILERGTNGARVEFPEGWALVILGRKVWLQPPLPPPRWEMPVEVGERRPFLTVSAREAPGTVEWCVPEGSVLRSRRPGDRAGGKDVRKLLAGTGHPPWVRDRWPLLAQGDEILAVWKLYEAPTLAGGLKIWVGFHSEKLRAGERNQDS